MLKSVKKHKKTKIEAKHLAVVVFLAVAIFAFYKFKSAIGGMGQP